MGAFRPEQHVLEYGVGIARKGGFGAAQVFNTLDLATIEERWGLAS